MLYVIFLDKLIYTVTKGDFYVPISLYQIKKNQKIDFLKNILKHKLPLMVCLENFREHKLSQIVYIEKFRGYKL